MILSHKATFASLLLGTAALLTLFATSEISAQRGPPPEGGGRMRPTEAMLKACTAKQANDACTAEGENGETITGSCRAPEGRPLACRPPGGGPGGGRPGGGRGPGGGGGPPPSESNSGTPISTSKTFTNGILCSHMVNTRNEKAGLISKAQWSCDNGQRQLTANGVPDHIVGSFPNAGNPNGISEQAVQFTVTTSPVVYSGPGGRVKEPVMGLNGVKFDPGTAGSCADDVTDPGQCPLGRAAGGRWNIEALAQDVFDFGEDMSNAHVQPSGAYHYHGVPVGMLSADALEGRKMAMIGWAADGFPVYARYGFPKTGVMLGALKMMKPSYRLKQRPDAGRPATTIIPMGAFGQDWEYVAGLADLDECNGRFGSTPEFPDGIYHYYATDAYPYIQRCVKGSIIQSARRGPPPGGRQGGPRGGREGGPGGRPN